MKRCYLCGKSLQKNPSGCRHCGNFFCSDHLLPENHHCTGGYKQYCENCGRFFLLITSRILLSIIEKIRKDINNIFLKIENGNNGVPRPKISYAVLVSVLILGVTTSLVLLDITNAGAQFFNTSAKDSRITHSDLQKYETGATTRLQKYVLHGESGNITVKMYSGVYNELSSEHSPTACLRYDNDKSPCTNFELQEYYLQYLDNPIQKKELGELIHSIESKTSNQDDRARIAISLVQNIPYDWDKFLNSTTNRTKSPYMVLYENKGVCSEKSLLLAFLLRELGYGVVLFTFESENHMAVGIKSPIQYSYENSGYAFIESTSPTIITDSQGNYSGAGKLTSIPEQYNISDGSSFSSITEEYQDSIEFNQLLEGNRILTAEEYRRWEILVWKYGIATKDGRTIQENPSNKPVCDGGRLCNGRCWNECEFGSLWTCTPEGVTCYPIF